MALKTVVVVNLNALRTKLSKSKGLTKESKKFPKNINSLNGNLFVEDFK